MGELKIQIPELLRIRQTDQSPGQIKDFTVDLGIGSLLRAVFDKSPLSAASLPGYRNLLLLLQNPYAEKSVIRFRQDMFNEIFQRSLERSLDHIASKLSFCSTAIRSYPNESLSQYLAREEVELKERVEEFRTAIESLNSILMNVESEGLQQVLSFAKDIKNSEEFQEIEQRLRNYIQASRKCNHPFVSWLFPSRKSRCEAILKGKQERFSFLTERTKLNGLEDQLKVYTAVVRFFRKLQNSGTDVCLPEILDSCQRTSRITGAVNPILAHVKGGGVVPSDAHYSPDKNIYVITGPNNGGKTTFARTVGLLCLLAHAGFYVSANSAEISMVDNIFTHFIKSDDLVKGEGRYAAELTKVKRVFEKATPYSLVILDEPCSGTSYQEGVEQSMILLSGFHKLGCAVYFVTHMHDIARRVEEGVLGAAANLSVGVRFDNGNPVFDYKVKDGAGQKSYGLELAESMGLGSKQLDALIRDRIESGDLPADTIRLVQD